MGGLTHQRLAAPNINVSLPDTNVHARPPTREEYKYYKVTIGLRNNLKATNFRIAPVEHASDSASICMLTQPSSVPPSTSSIFCHAPMLSNWKSVNKRTKESLFTSAWPLSKIICAHTITGTLSDSRSCSLESMVVMFRLSKVNNFGDISLPSILDFSGNISVKQVVQFCS